MQVQLSAFETELEKLLSRQKEARFNNDYNEALRIAKAIVTLCLESGHYPELIDTTENLCKRRGQHKKVQIQLVQGCFTSLGHFSGEQKTKVVERIRDVCDKKIFLEVEYARCVMLLVREKQGSDLGEAAKILQQVQVQTYGSMDKREKVEFILYQMRIMLRREDYVRFFIISKKITEKNLDEPLFDLKMQFHAYLATYFNHQKQYREASQAYKSILSILLAKKDLQKLTVLDFGFDASLASVFSNYISFTCLQEYSDSQISQLNETKAKFRDLYSGRDSATQLANAILSNQLVNSQLEAYNLEGPVFTVLPGWQSHRKMLRDRLIEHNIRTCSLYYSRIGLLRMSELAGCLAEQCEGHVCRLMNKKILKCSIDRIEQVVDFHIRVNQNELLQQWTQRVNQVLELVDQASSLIQQELPDK